METKPDCHYLQERIQYHEIIALGFTEIKTNDSVYFQEFGFPYVIITKQLSKEIYLDWEKHTQFCELIRMDKPKVGSISKRYPVKNLAELKTIIDFFTDEKDNVYTTIYKEFC
jgi:hypothetical protein